MEGFEVGNRQLRLVVQHFLEMRHVPIFVHRVAVKAAAEMIVHASRGHFLERLEYHLPRSLRRCSVDVAKRRPKQKIQDGRAGEFRGVTESSFAFVKRARQLFVRLLQDRGLDAAGRL